MRAYLDTSALIRAWRVGVVPEGITRAHSVSEFYCVLTGPGLLSVIDGKQVRVSLSPDDGRHAAWETFAKVRFHDVGGREALATLDLAVKANISGRLIHDWMHAGAAAQAECDTLVTLNTKDFARMVRKTVRLISPADYFAS